MRLKKHPNTIINRDAEGYAHGHVEIWQMTLNQYINVIRVLKIYVIQ